MNKLSLAALVVALSLVPAVALAEPWDLPVEDSLRWQGDHPTFRNGAASRGGLVLTLGFFTGGQSFGGFGRADAWSFSAQVRGAVVIERFFELGVSGGLAWGLFDPSSGPTQTGLSALNPQIYGGWIGGDRTLRLRLGGSVGIPVASSSTYDALALSLAAGSYGALEYGVFAPETLAITPAASIEYAPLFGLYAAGRFATAILIPTGDTRGREAELVVQPVVELGYQAGPVLIAARLGAWLYATGPDRGDNAQVSVEPFIRYHVQAGSSSSVFFTGGFLMNLDSPYGFSFDTGRVWGIHLGVGGALTD